MSGVLNYAVGLLSEPRDVLTDCATYAAEVERLFATLRELADMIWRTPNLPDVIAEQLLQPPRDADGARSDWHSYGD